MSYTSIYLLFHYHISTCLFSRKKGIQKPNPDLVPNNWQFRTYFGPFLALWSGPDQVRNSGPFWSLWMFSSEDFGNENLKVWDSVRSYLSYIFFFHSKQQSWGCAQHVPWTQRCSPYWAPGSHQHQTCTTSSWTWGKQTPQGGFFDPPKKKRKIPSSWQPLLRAGSQPFMGGEAHAGMAIGAENILVKVLTCIFQIWNIYW